MLISILITQQTDMLAEPLQAMLYRHDEWRESISSGGLEAHSLKC